MPVLANLSTSGRWLSVGALSLGTAALLVRLARRARRSRLPGEDVPWAKGWWPIIGNLPTYLRYYTDNSEVAHGRMAIDVREKEGHGVFQLEIVGVKFVVVCEADLVGEVLQNEPGRFTKDFREALGPAGDFFLEMFGESGLFFVASDDRRWGIAHRILKAPFSVKGVKSLFPMMCDQADRLVDTIKREVGYGKACHIDSWVTKMAFETIAVCGLGTSFGSWNDAVEHPFIAALKKMIEGTIPFSVVPKCLWSVFLRKQTREMREHRALVEGTCLDVIRKRRDNITQNATGKADLMDMMLNETDAKTGSKMTETMILDNVLTFLFAGQDSTAAAMASCLCFLHANPGCKAKLLQEIDEVVGAGSLEWDHLGRMTYLDWCIKETLRLAPPVPSTVRASSGSQLLGGRYRIDPGTQVMISVMALHYDAKIWGADVQAFRPERWESPPAHKYAYLPFVSGPRACTGREFTLVEQKATIVKLLQHFDYRRPEHVEPEAGYVTMQKKDQLYPPFLDMDVEMKKVSGFVGLTSSFELSERHPSVNCGA